MSGIQSMLLSASGLVPGNSGIITSSGPFTLPSTSGLTVNVLVIAGGGGGGGGSGRTYASGYYTGGGGGGAGGNAYAQISVTPGATLNCVIGAPGSAGVTRDGIYSSGSNGGAGGYVYVNLGTTTVAYAEGGSGGVVSPTGTGGASGYAVFGTALVTPATGGAAGSGTTYGGIGAKGYQINTTVGATTILTYGSDGVTYPEGSSNYNVAGTGWGAGGSGGSCAQSDVYSPHPIYATTGASGSTNPSPGTQSSAIFIWWGY